MSKLPFRKIISFLSLTLLALLFPLTANAATTFTDNFNGSSLNTSVWTWQNPSGSQNTKYTVSNGTFNVTVARNNDQWIGIDKAPRILKTQPAAPYTLETRITSNNGNGPTFGGLVVFKNDMNWLLFGQLSNNSLEASGLLNNVWTKPQGKFASKFNYLRIRKVNTNYYFDASANGVNWTNVNVINDPNNYLSGAKVGIMAKNWNTGSLVPSLQMKFDYYKEDNTDLMPSVLSDVVTTTQIAKETGSDSINQTNAVNVCGTDLGELFDWMGKTFIAFGDTNDCGSAPPRNNTLAFTTDTTPADGLRFDGWATNSAGLAKELFHADVGTVTAIPTSGISVGNTAYLYYMQVSSWSPWTCNQSSIASANGSNIGAWTKHNVKITGNPEIPAIKWNQGNFNIVAVAKEGTTVYVWGVPCGRFGSVKLMKVPENAILTQGAYEYFTGYDASGNPTWATNNEAAAVTVAGGPAGEISVQYNTWLNRYIMTYLDEEKAAIVLRESPKPWGPWSAPIQIAKGSQYPALYGAFMKSSYFENNGESIYYMMSLWGPYNTFWMKSTLTKK